MRHDTRQPADNPGSGAAVRRIAAAVATLLAVVPVPALFARPRRRRNLANLLATRPATPPRVA